MGTTVNSGEPGWPLAFTCGPGVALPAPASRLTVRPAAGDTEPEPAAAGADMTAIPLPGLAADPGSGQTRVTEVTSASRGCCGGVPAASETVRCSPASPYSAPRMTMTATAGTHCGAPQALHDSPSPGSRPESVRHATGTSSGSGYPPRSG